MAWTFSLSILEELFNFVFTLKSIVMFTIVKVIKKENHYSVNIKSYALKMIIPS